MKEILIDTLINALPELVAIFMGVLAAVVSRWLIPLIKDNTTKNQLEAIDIFVTALVQSAQRLDKTGKLENITKKDYVMNKLNEFIAQNKYKFTEDQLDDIRRAAVLALENAEKIVSDGKDELLGEEDKQ